MDLDGLAWVWTHHTRVQLSVTDSLASLRVIRPFLLHVHFSIAFRVVLVVM